MPNTEQAERARSQEGTNRAPIAAPSVPVCLIFHEATSRPPSRFGGHVQIAARLDRLYHSCVRGIASAFAAASIASRQPEVHAAAR
jgi:hypothetical protein